VAVLIIGYGNPLRGDDAFGYRAAEELQALFLDHRDVVVLPVHQLTPELAADIARAGRVVFIDAAAEGEPGKLVCRPVLPAAASAAGFTHSAAPEGLLGMALALYGNAPPAVLYSVRGESFACGAALTPPVERALAEAVRAAGAEIAAARA
jgi:hydrogenase maturation protease